MLPETARHALPKLARRSASAPSKSAAGPVWRRTQSSISALPGPVSKARISSGSVADPGHIADAAEVQHRERLPQTGGERGVVQRRERRPLPAGGDIGAAEIADDIDPGQPRQQRAVADLPGAALLGTVQDRVPMEPDQVDRDLRKSLAKSRHGFGMQPGQLGLDRGDLRAGRRRRARRAACRGTRPGTGTFPPVRQ